MMTKTTYTVCLCGALGSLAIGFASGVWSLMSAEDALIFPLVTGPYVVIAAVAWWRRASSWESQLLLGAVLLIVVYGLWAISSSAYRFHTNPRDEVAMDLTAVVVPALQWLVAVSVAALLGVIVWIRSVIGGRAGHRDCP